MDLQDKIDLGAAMFGTPAIDRGATTMLAEVASDAADGEVVVKLPDETGAVQLVTVPCNGDIREGDTATLIIEDGHVTALSASGEGERAKAETDAAQSAADTAQSTATDAKDTADAASTKADAASETAGEASTKADAAQSAATDASTKADAAQSAADTAQSTATDASTKADAAQSAATDASTKADAASETATQAQTAAGEASTKADAAKDAADTAKDTADAAQSAADAAQSTADEAKSAAATTKQYFWHDGEGAHVSETAHEDGAAVTGKNLLATSDGVQVRDGVKPLTKMNANAFLIYDGKGNDSVNVIGLISANSATFNRSKLEIKCVDATDFDWDRGVYTYTARTTIAANPPLRAEYSSDYRYSSIAITTAAGSGDSTVISGSYSTKHYGLDVSIGDWQEGGLVRIGGEQIELIAQTNNEYCDEPACIHFYAEDIKWGKDNASIALLAYPVGSIYMSVNSTSPADLFGGTWEELAGGRVLMGQNSTYAAGSTGGAVTHTHTGPAHTHVYGLKTSSYYGCMGTTNTNGSLFQLYNNGTTWVNGKSNDGAITTKVNTGLNAASASKTVSSPYATANTSSSGTGATGYSSSFMPYLCVYMWKRTA